MLKKKAVILILLNSQIFLNKIFKNILNTKLESP
jgi:hypothetical protein